MQKRYSYISIIILSLILAACSNTRKLPAGEALYTGAEIKVDGPELSKKQKKALRGELSSLTRPRRNKKILGMRFKLAMYNLAGNPKKENSPAGILKNKIGEPPVLLSELSLSNNEDVLRSNLENTGYFKATVEGDTVIKNRKATAIYKVQTGYRYTINEINFEKDSSVLSRQIDTASKNTLLKVGDPFNLSVVKDERERIESYLKEKGFYFFDPDFIIVRVDSTIGQNKINLYVQVKKATPVQARKVYTINDVYVFPGYRLSSPTGDTLKSNAQFYRGYYVVDRRKLYKPKMFAQSMRLCSWRCL